MKLKFIFAAALTIAVAGCSSPRSQIIASCEKEQQNSTESCECFADSLEKQLSAEQYKAFADAVSSSNESEEAQKALQERMGLGGMMTIAGAAKSCGMATQ